MSTTEAPLVCRPSPLLWGVVAFWLGMAGLSLSLIWQAHAQAGWFRWVFPIGMSLPFFLLAGVTSFLVGGSRVVADGTGLCWREWGKERHARWEEVRDYYLGSRREAGGQCVVETAVGKLCFGSELAHYAELRERIAARAVNAPHTGWMRKGLRPCDWPWTCHRYPRKWALAEKVFLWGIGVAGLGCCVWMALGLWNQRASLALMGPLWGTAAALVSAAMILAFAFMSVLVPALARDAPEADWDAIVADQKGLCLHRGPERFSVPWSDVRGVRSSTGAVGMRPVQPAILTRGREFRINPSRLRDTSLLRALIDQRGAGDAAALALETAAEQLGSETERWSSGCVGLGERVFHYRTRTNRALLWLASVPVSFFIMLPLHSAGMLPHSNPGAVLWLASLGTLGFLWSWWRYRTGRITLDDQGITEWSPLGKRRLRWEQVERYWTTHEGPLPLGHLSGRGVELRFWLTVSDYKELDTTIRQRAAQALVQEP